MRPKEFRNCYILKKNESSRGRVAVDASVMMYEWCEDLNELTGKKYQDIAQSCCPIIHSSCASAKGVHWIIVHNFNLLT